MPYLSPRNQTFVGRIVTPKDRISPGGLYTPSPYRRHVIVEVLDICENDDRIGVGSLVIMNRHHAQLTLSRPEFDYDGECRSYYIRNIEGEYVGTTPAEEVDLV